MLLVEDTARCGLRVPFTRELRHKGGVAWTRRQLPKSFQVHATNAALPKAVTPLGNAASVQEVAEASAPSAKAVSDGSSQAASQLQAAGGAAKDLSNLSSSASAADPSPAIGEATRQASEAASNVPEAASSAVQAADSTSASAGASGIFEGLQNTFNDVSKSVTDAASSLKQSITSGISGGQDSISGLSDGASNALQNASSSLETLRQAASAAAEDLGVQTLQSADNVLYSLPDPVRQTIQAIASPIVTALEIPSIRNAVIVLSIGYSSYLWFTARFGGFAGRLSPAEALNVLDSEDAVLLDVRPDLMRENQGIPELRFGARNKGVALPLVRIKQKSGTQIVKSSVLSFQVAAILVQGLGKVSMRSKIIVLSDSETQAVSLARAIATEIKLRAYVLKGGFPGWAAAGLPVKDGTEYESSAIAGFNDTVEGSILPFIRNPLTLVGAVLLAIGVSAVVIDEHKTFQFIGTFGLLATFGTIPLRYNSLQAARDDIFGPYLKVTNFFLGLVPKSKPKTSATATPSTSMSTSQPVSGSNGQKPMLDDEADYDDGYGDILKEDTGTQPVSKKEDVPTKKPALPKGQPAKTSNLSPSQASDPAPAESSKSRST